MLSHLSKTTKPNEIQSKIPRDYKVYDLFLCNLFHASTLAAYMFKNDL